MELRQLRYFVAVANELHFGRAAARLHISQPPLSVQIRRLEAELGVTLLTRSTRHVELTPAGAELASRLQSALPELDACFADLQEVQSGHRGHLTVGFVSSANYSLLPAAVRLFRQRRPNVTLRLLPLTSAEQINALYEHSIDMGIVRDTAANSSLQFTPVLTEHLVACVPSAHTLAGQEVVTTEALLQLPMITFPYGLMPGYIDRIRSLFGTRSTDLQAGQQVVHQETALSFVGAGEGFAILPESVAVAVPDSVTTVAIENAPQTSLLAATMPDHLSPACEAFLNCL
ncbi:LysR family transcriptional regulator [Pseudoclavibacter sp. CFCC 13796]|uniref:LysR family transcriptional regulator n=1 Tax=Pseudoclavibacter sp. CFCC 13796 TaxID=2615179 RepID=UPI001787C6AC|nr:LysR substrate-binding domain-containing protein [Pseudoclavibacter sp. CFCC 13796]